MGPSKDPGHKMSPGLADDVVLKLLQSGAHTQAWVACRQLMGRHSHPAGLLVSAAATLMQLEQPAEAERYMQEAAVLEPNSAVIWNNLGLSFRNQNRIPDSLRCFERALQLQPEWARAHYDRALALLVWGDYAQGFREHEHRWGATGMERPGDSEPAIRERLWNGEDPRGKRILLYAEQGLGDTVQFVRYASILKMQGADVVIEVQPMLRELMSWLRPECEISDGNAASLGFDLQCALMTLPMIFGTRPESIPAPAVFEVPSAMQTKWRMKIPASNRLNIALVWAGNPANPIDHRRSTDLQTLDPILADEIVCKNANLFSFQVGSRATQLSESPHRSTIYDVSPELSAATETAAALLQIDLVITVETFVAHLAASLGRPVWLLSAFAPDWRWFLEREDSPWYPSIRLFRQKTSRDWPGLVARVRDVLRQLLNSRTRPEA